MEGNDLKKGGILFYEKTKKMPSVDYDAKVAKEGNLGREGNGIQKNRGNVTVVYSCLNTPFYGHLSVKRGVASKPTI